MLRTLDPRQLDGDARAFGLGYLLLLPLYLAPLFVARYLPGLDLPFHLSMVDMLAKGGSPQNPYAGHYLGDLSIAPYAAHYLALLLLSKAMPLMVAHKLIIAIYVAALPLGAALLLDANGRSRVPALLGFPLAYNLTLHYGFISFALSLPALLFMLAALCRFLTSERMRLGVGIATGALSVLLFLCHLQNFLFGLCAAATFIALAGVSWRRRLLGVAAMMPSVVCLVTWHFTREFQGPAAAQKKTLAHAWQVLKRDRLSEIGAQPLLDEMWHRLQILPVHALRGFTDQVDVIASRALVVVVCGYIMVALIAAGYPGGSLPKPRMRIASWVLLAGAVTAYLGMPHHLREFELMTFYPRFAVLVLAMLLLVIPASLRRLDGIGRVVVVLPAVVLGAIYSEQLIRHYRYYDREVADFSAVIDKVPPGGRAVGLVFDRHSRVMKIESALVGLPHLYPILRPSPTSMTPVFYCGMRHMPCAKLPNAAPIPDPGPWNARQFALASPAADFFDYVLIRSPPPGPLFGAAHNQYQLLGKSGTWLAYARKRLPPGPPAKAPPTPVKPAAPAPAVAAPAGAKASVKGQPAARRPASTPAGRPGRATPTAKAPATR